MSAAEFYAWLGNVIPQPRRCLSCEKARCECVKHTPPERRKK